MLTPPKLAGGESPPRVNRAEQPPTRIPSVHPSTTPPRKDQQTRAVKSKAAVKNTSETKAMTKKIDKKLPLPPPLKEHQPRMSNIRKQRKGAAEENEPTQRRGISPPRPIATSPDDLGIDFHRRSWHSDNSWEESNKDYLDKEARDLSKVLRNLSPNTKSKVIRENAPPVLKTTPLTAVPAPPEPAKPRFAITKSEVCSYETRRNYVVQSVLAMSENPVVEVEEEEVMVDVAPVEVIEPKPLDLPVARASVPDVTSPPVVHSPVRIDPPRLNPLASLDIWRGGRPPRERRPSEGADVRVKKDVDLKTHKYMKALPPSERECVAFILALKPLVAPRASLLDYLQRVDSTKVKALLPLKEAFNALKTDQDARSPDRASPKPKRESIDVTSRWMLSPGQEQALVSRAIRVPDWAAAEDAFGLIATVRHLNAHLDHVDTIINSDARKADRAVRRRFLRSVCGVFARRLRTWVERTCTERLEHLLVRRLLACPVDDPHVFTFRAASITYATLKDAIDRPEFHSEPSVDVADALGELVSLQHKGVVLRQQTNHLLNMDLNACVNSVKVAEEEPTPESYSIPNPLEDMYERLFTEQYVARLRRSRQKWVEYDTSWKLAKEGVENLDICGNTLDLKDYIPSDVIHALNGSVDTIVNLGAAAAVTVFPNEQPPTPASGWHRRSSLSKRVSNLDLDFSVKRLMAMPFTPVTVHNDFLGKSRHSIMIASSSDRGGDVRDTPVPSRSRL